jgi:hypothetical protein
MKGKHLFVDREMNWFKAAILSVDCWSCFVNEVEIQLNEKPLQGSQTQEIYYSEDKASTKTVTLTYPYAVTVSYTLTSNERECFPTKSPT